MGKTLSIRKVLETMYWHLFGIITLGIGIKIFFTPHIENNIDIAKISNVLKYSQSENVIFYVPLLVFTFFCFVKCIKCYKETFNQ